MERRSVTMTSRLDDAIRRWDVVPWLRRQGHDVRLTETGQVRISCTHCRDGKYRLYIDRKTHAWLCFNCPGKGRSAITYIKWVVRTDDDDRAVDAIVSSMSRLKVRDQDEDDDEEYERPRRT